MKFKQDQENFNGHLPDGQSSALVTGDASDNARRAYPVGSGGISASFVPPSLPVAGLELLMDANTIGGGDGTVLPAWIDTSGHNRVGLANGSPVLKTGANGINGRNVVRFAAGGGVARSCDFEVGIDPRTWSGLSVYYVARTGAGTPFTRWGGVFGWQATGQWLNVALGNDLSGANQGCGWTDSSGSTSFGDVTGFAAGKVIYGSYRYDKAHWTLDGVRSTTIADTSWPTAATVALIGSNTAGFSQSDNDLGFLAVYSRKLTDDEDAQVKTYLQYIAGLSTILPATKLQVGYPDTCVNYFAERYVHPAGSNTDPRCVGKNWDTAKQTWLSAWDDAAASNPGAVIVLHVHDGSYVGAPGGLGLCINSSATVDNDPLPGWRREHPFIIIGHGGTAVSNVFTPAKARFNRGVPGDSQKYDSTKPHLWFTGAGHGSSFAFKNLQPAVEGFARLGVVVNPDGSAGTRDGNLENVTFENVGFASGPDSGAAGTFGPCWDMGWVSESYFIDCSAVGSATFRSITIAGGDGANSGTSRITLANASFDSTWVGGFLLPNGTGTAMDGLQWNISSVVDVHTVVVTRSGTGAAPPTVTFSTSGTMQGFPGPTVLDDDNHAGWMIRPTGPDGSGDVGSLGINYFRRIGTLCCGIKQYVGADGECGIDLDRFLSEGGPMPHAIQIAVVPGANLPNLVSAATFIKIKDVEVADNLSADNYRIYIDQRLHSRFGVGTVKYENVDGDVYGPGLWVGNDIGLQAKSTTPNAAGLLGYFKSGYLSGRVDAGRRPGFPATAQATSTGATGNKVTNLLSDDPTGVSAGSAAWTGTSATGVADKFGLTNAARIAAGAGTMSIPQSSVAPATVTTVTGDLVVAGVWVRAKDGPLSTAASVTVHGGGAGSLTLVMQPVWRGNAEWEWLCGYAAFASGGTQSFTLDIAGVTNSAIEACYPLLQVLKLSDGYTVEEAAERATNGATWNPRLAQGGVGTLLGQPLVGSGGIGVGSSIPSAPSGGSATNTKNVPLLSDDGRTIQGYLPLLPTNSPLPAGTVTSVGFTAPLKNTGSSTAVVGAIDDFVASGGSHARGAVPDPGSSAGSTKLLCENATWKNLALSRVLAFYLDTFNPISNPGYLFTTKDSAVSATAISYPLGQAATGARLMADVIANTLTTSGGTGVITLGFYQNAILQASVTALTTVAAGTVIDTGLFTTLGSSLDTDVWAVRISSTGVYFSGGISLALSLIAVSPA